jgi:hypothetical protein
LPLETADRFPEPMFIRVPSKNLTIMLKDNRKHFSSQYLLTHFKTTVATPQLLQENDFLLVINNIHRAYETNDFGYN